MKILTIALAALMIFFHVLFLPFAFLISCFKLSLVRTDEAMEVLANEMRKTLERRKK